nr:hypothetical protein [Tanacetum cinerariifolium]
MLKSAFVICYYVIVLEEFSGLMVLYIEKMNEGGGGICGLKKAQEKDKIGSKPDKNGKRAARRWLENPRVQSPLGMI